MRPDSVPNLIAKLGSVAGTVGTTEEAALDLDTVPQNPAFAVLTHRRQPGNRALEAVEGMHLPTDSTNLEGHPVVIPTRIANSHAITPLSTQCASACAPNPSPATGTPIE